MEKANYSIIVVNHRHEAAQRIIRIANELHQEVTAVANKDELVELYSPDVKCIVLELSRPNACGIDVIRYLGEQNCRAELILTTNISSGLLTMAWKLATGMGLTVADMFLKPYDLQRLRRALVSAVECSGVANG